MDRSLESLVFGVERDRFGRGAVTRSAARNRTILVARGLFGLGFGLVTLLTPIGLEPAERFLAMLFVMIVMPLMHFVIFRHLPDRWADLASGINDLTLAMVGCLLLPPLIIAALIAIGSITIAAVAVLPRQQALVISVAGIVTTAGLAYTQDIPLWYLSPIALILLIPSFYLYFLDHRERGAEAERRFRALVEAAPIFFWEVDQSTGCFLTVAGNCEPLLGYRSDELVGQPWRVIIPTEDQEKVVEVGTLGVDEGSMVADIVRRDQAVRTFRHSMSVSDDGQIVRGVSADITELAEANAAVRTQARQDHLTGLSNRMVLIEHLDRAASEAEANGGAALVMFDLDRFKEVNDTLGHPTGDRLLQVLSERLVEEIPEADVVARLGGDEFAVLVSGNVERQDAVEVGRRIFQACERQTEIDGIRLVVTPSIGIALMPEHGEETDQILQRADIAMYEAKRSNSALKVYDHTPSEFSLERLTLGADIASAFDNDEFELWFQPKVAIDSEAILGFEGLVRWRHPHRGILSPFEFLELVDLSGDAHRFGLRICELGIDFAQQLVRVGSPAEVAVNMSANSFLDNDLPNWLASRLDEAGVRPSSFTLEITESDILSEDGTYLPIFEALKSLGVGLSIDDFGTGYSSLTRLLDLPVSEVKLDRSFVKEVQHRPESLHIVRAVIGLATHLNLHTIAEGVEEAETIEILRDLGCQAIQGYFYAKPMPVDEAIQFLLKWPHGTSEWPSLEPSGDQASMPRQLKH